MTEKRVLCVRVSFLDSEDSVMHLNPRVRGLNWKIDHNKVTVTGISVCFHDAADEHGLERIAVWRSTKNQGE
jgi:hypothetical protein